MDGDKQLLMDAAKAAGMNEWKWSGLGMSKMLDPSNPEKTGSIGNNWNPLTDDGDALRLAVKLNFLVDSSAIQGATDAGDGTTFYQCELHNGDPYAATRRAIVRAAAEIGKSL